MNCKYLIIYVKVYMVFRDETDEVFHKLHSEKIPLIVLSAGIGDVVQLILAHENLLTDNVSVVSNFLKVSEDEDGLSTILGFKDEKLIHVFNKNENAYIDTHKNVRVTTIIYLTSNKIIFIVKLNFLCCCQDTHLSGRFNVILLGDSLGDANMDGGIPYNTVLRIGFLNSDLVIP